jgi:hypothetical protein
MLRKKAKAVVRLTARRDAHHALLGLLLQHRTGVYNDVARIVIGLLPANSMVLCSMVSTHLRHLVDSLGGPRFSEDLMWCGSFEPSATECADSMITASFAPQTSLFDLQLTLKSPGRKVMWLLNTHPVVNGAVRMRLAVMVPTDSPHVRLTGDSKCVQKVLQRGVASVDVISWLVVSVVHESADCCLFGPTCTVRMTAQHFVHRDRKVALEVRAPVVLTVRGVPFQKMKFRCLWVMRGIRRCMHCHQRWRHMQSFDVRDANHRVLCSHCLDLLYARETQLVRRWKVNAMKMPPDRVPRAHFVNCFSGAPTTAWPAKPDRLVLKQDVATFHKCASWTEFIQQNHKHYRPAQRWNSGQCKSSDRYYFSSRWF